MTKNAHQVMPALNGGWNVKRYGSDRATKHFRTKAEAEAWGRALSIKQGSELFIHRRDGTVAEKNSYSRDAKK